MKELSKDEINNRIADYMGIDRTVVMAQFRYTSSLDALVKPREKLLLERNMSPEVFSIIDNDEKKVYYHPIISHLGGTEEHLEEYLTTVPALALATAIYAILEEM